MLKSFAALGLQKFVRVIKSTHYAYPNVSRLLYPAETEVFRESSFLTPNKGITSIALLQDYDLIAFACEDGKVRVYSTRTSTNNGSREKLSVFDRHNDKVTGMIDIGNNILASVSKDGVLHTWNALSSEHISSLRFDEGEMLFSISKLDHERIAIGSYQAKFSEFVGPAQIIFVNHRHGNDLNVLHRINGCYYWITTMISNNGFLVTASGGQGPNRYSATSEKYATVWDANTYEYLVDLFYEGFSLSTVAINSEFIVVGANGLFVYKIHQDFEFVATICKTEIFMKTQFLSNDLLIACTRSGRLILISLNSKSITHKLLPVKGRRITDFVLLPDGRIGIGTQGGMCALIDPPETYKKVILDSL